MPSTTTDLAIRKWLREVSLYHIDRLIDHSWNTVRAVVIPTLESKLDVNH